MYADDIMLHVSHESKEKTENNLNQDTQNLLSYFRKNYLLINLKKGKTEIIRFGTTNCLKTAGEINPLYNKQIINFTETYKYLGNIVDHHLNFSENFEKSYKKKASSRLRLLEQMRCYLTSKAARLGYVTMIIPLLTSSCTLRPPCTNTQKQKYNSLDRRARKFIKLNVPLIENLANRERVLPVKSCLCKESNEEFNNYFKLIEHKYENRHNSKSIKLPHVKLELTQQGFYFSEGVL